MSGTSFALSRHRAAGPAPSRSVTRTMALTLVVAIVAAVCTPACSSSPERSAEAFCTAYVDVARQATRLADPDSVSLATLRRSVDDLAEAADDASAVAPDEIADTVDEVTEPLHDFSSALDDATSRTDANKAWATYRAAATKVAPAQQRLGTWTDAHCGVTAVTSTTAPVTIHPGITG